MSESDGALFGGMTGVRTPTTDVIVGVAMIVLSVACALAYSVVLKTIWSDAELIRLSSYKFMFMLGVCDAIQCVPHAVTGVFTIYQSTGSYWLAKMMGVLASPFYVTYAILTVILSIQMWLGFAGCWTAAYIVAQSSPWATIRYLPEIYSWAYDNELAASEYVRKVAMVIEVGGIFVSGALYIGVVACLIRTRQRFSSSRNYSSEAKILIQAATITVYCSILNILWHNYEWLLPNDLWVYCALNFMWILNSGVYPIVYFIVNGGLRRRILAKARSTKLASTTPDRSIM